jgi:predicted ATPase
MQRIEIRNFGPIKNVAFDIKDYTVFIGAQASGKSTIARAVYFFQSLDEELRSAMSSSMPDCHKEEVIKTFKKNIAKKAETIWNSSFWNSKTTLRFHYKDDLEITVSTANDGDYLVVLSSGWNELFRTVETMLYQIQKERGEKSMLPNDRFLFTHTAAQLFPFPHNGLTFIPAGRVLFSSIEESLIPREQKLADVLVAKFFDLCEFIKRKYTRQPIRKPRLTKKKCSMAIHKILSLSKTILCGTVEFKDNKCFLSLPDQKTWIQIADTSSGQQEAVWILLYVMYLCDLGGSRMFTVIEEPEAHLFPESQRNMMYVLTLLANQNKNQLMLTTHSPYILTPLNNLLLAHHIGKKKWWKVVEKIVDPDLWIDPDRFECYYVGKGTIRSVMDRKTGMMNLDELDAVSSTLNEQYDRLTELED